MTRLIFTETFVASASQIYSKQKRDEVRKVVQLLKTSPYLGSNNLPKSIVEEFGSSVRKLSIDPFDVVYEYNKTADEVVIFDIIHQRSAY